MINRLRNLFKSSPQQEKKSIIDQVIDERLTYLERKALAELAEAAAGLERDKVPGIFIENGCALGGSSIVISTHKSQQRPFYIYDVFGLIPSPGEKDTADVHERYKEITEGKSKGIGGDVYYGYQPELLEKVKSNFVRHGIDPVAHHINFVQGLYEDSLKVDQPVAFAHIDCDWYDSVWVCLERIVPHLSDNGLLVIDDYYFWKGCQKAVDDFFEGKKDGYEFTRHSRLHIRKKAIK